MGKKQSKRFQGIYPGLIVGLLLLAVVWARPVQAQTIEVSPTGVISTITEAIAQADLGDEITVHPGVYKGQLLIDKRVKLTGIDYPKIEGGGIGDTITIKADGVTFQGFEVRGSGRRLEHSDAGIKIFSKNNIVKDNHILDNLFGLYLNKASQNILEGNLIHGLPVQKELEQSEAKNNQYSGMHPAFEGDGGDGIHLFAASENKVIKNTIKDTRDGIYFNYASDNELIGNRISNVRYGIHYMYSDSNTFQENILINNVAGAALMFSKDITFKQNIFAHSRGHRSYGLLFATCDDSLAEGNIFINNTRGAFFDVSLRNEFRNNLVTSNDVGIDLISSSSDNLFVGNNLIDNLQQVAMIAGQVGDGNAFSKEGQGNYWNDYRGFDLDRNGIGDIPYLSGDPFTYLMKKAPAVRLFLNSPAATALEFSERMFPIINVPKVKDSFPYVKPIPLQLPNLDEEFSMPTSSNKVLGLYSLAMLTVAGLIFYRVKKQGGTDMSKKIAAIIFVFAMSLLLIGCSKQVDTSPRPIDSSLDICPTCNMSIIDLHYAGEIVTQEGLVEKFDDIGCLALYLKKHSQEPAFKESVVYVKDYKTMDWIIAAEATYIKAHINTPMNFGIVGFGSLEAAQSFEKELEDTTLMNWQEVLKAKQTVSF